MAENIGNDFTTTLSGAILSGATSLVVASSTGAPSPDFRVRIDDELFKVTAVAGTTWTVTGAQEGTSAAGHASGAQVAHVLTKAGLDQYWLDYYQTKLRRFTAAH